MYWNLKQLEMKNFIIILFVGLMNFAAAQNVILSKVAKVHDNKDKIFYRINPQHPEAEYLGEVEVQGFSEDDAEIFLRVYSKAKEIGANAFAYAPVQAIEGGFLPFDPWNYKLALYYLPSHLFSEENNMLYLFAPSNKKQKMTLNEKNITLQPRTFTKQVLQPGNIYTISTGKLLGSSAKFSAQDSQPAQYIQIMPFRIGSNASDNPGINIKTGDIQLLEKSYAQFLTVIYKEF